MKGIIFLLSTIFMFGCANEFSDEKDFRNYLRDNHPYSDLDKIKLGRWSYQVNDTINNQTWIYIGSTQEYRVVRHCVNCKLMND